VATYLYVSWEARDPLNDTEQAPSCIKTCFENRHEKYADLRTPFKILEINVVAQLFMACISIIFIIIAI